MPTPDQERPSSDFPLPTLLPNPGGTTGNIEIGSAQSPDALEANQQLIEGLASGTVDQCKTIHPN